MGSQVASEVDVLYQTRIQKERFLVNTGSLLFFKESICCVFALARCL